MNPREITLTELLESRDNRQALQKQLICSNPTLTLMVLTVIMPGKVKRNTNSLIVAEAGMMAIKERFAQHIRQSFSRDIDTGFEGWFLIDMPEEEAKRLTCEIEDNHPLGRLMDIDIIGKDLQPLTRVYINKDGRRCLLCDNDARLCMRQRTHTQEEIHARIKSMIDEYVG